MTIPLDENPHSFGVGSSQGPDGEGLQRRDGPSRIGDLEAALAYTMTPGEGISLGRRLIRRGR